MDKQTFSWNLDNFKFEEGFAPAIYKLRICYFSHSAMGQTPKTPMTRFEELGELNRLATFFLNFNPCYHLFRILIRRPIFVPNPSHPRNGLALSYNSLLSKTLLL
jgi:hypothetical protein